MPLTLHVDTPAWHDHLRGMVAAQPGLVPVAKGNGYGFTIPLLARTAAGLRVRQIAVGTTGDAAVALRKYPGDVIVLEEPARTGPLPVDLDRRVVCTAPSVQAVAGLAGHRLIVEGRTSLLRQGITEADLPALHRVTGGGRAIEAFSLHLPIGRPAGTDPVAQTARWVRALRGAGFQVPTMYVSHFEPAELAALAAAFRGTSFRQRVGTRLWLGNRTALHAAATVLQVVPVRRGERFGYRQYRAARDGWLVMVGGGTAHGVGLEVPGARRGLRPQGRALARFGLAAMHRVRSPFTWDGRKQWFAEQPHMLVSMLLLPHDTQPPQPGMELAAELRHTTTRFDDISMRPCLCRVDGHSGIRAVPRWTAGRIGTLSGSNLSADPPVKPSAALLPVTAMTRFPQFTSTLRGGGGTPRTGARRRDCLVVVVISGWWHSETYGGVHTAESG